MEPSEYATLFRQEERFWWYRGLHRLAEERLREAWSSARRLTTSGSPGTDAGGAHGGAAGQAEGASRPPLILDAGCGTGGMLRRLRVWGRTAGIDASPVALDFARRRDAGPLARASVTSLPFHDAAFDLILSLDVLYHRGVESDERALREFRRCLRPGGVLLLNLPAYEALRSAHDEAIHTARRYRRAGLRRLLESAGLRPERITHWNAVLFPGLALVRALRRQRRPAGHAPPPSDVVELPGWLDRPLGAVLAVERWWLRRRDLPFGLSILAVARRPETEEGAAE